ncbi:MAG: copper resistance protein CopC [Acidimicrobiales bacterium]
MTRLLAGAVMVVALIVFSPAPAGAHASLLGSEPADRQVLAAAPTQVVLRFSESVTMSGDSVKVLDERGKVLVAKGARHVKGQKDAVVLDLPDLEDGAYAATFRLISADSHPSVGAITFHVGKAGHDTHLATDMFAPAAGDRLAGLTFGLARFSVYASLIVLVGGVAFLTLLWPEGLRRRRPVAVLRGAWRASVVATAAAVVVQGPYAQGDGLGAIVSSSALGERYGRVGLLRLALLGVLWAVVVKRLREHPEDRPVERGLRNLTVVTSLAVLATLAAVGHSVTGRLTPLGIAADVVHLVAISLWMGGLVMLVVLLADKERLTELAGVVPRFSRLAFGAVVTIVVTGTVQSWRQLDGIATLTTTTFGRLLLAKVVLVSGLVGLGGLSRRLLRAHFSRPRVLVAVGPGAATLDPELELATRLRRSVGVEIVLGVAVLSITALLVNAIPGRSLAASKQGTAFSTELTQGGRRVVVKVAPARAGLNDVHIYTFGPAGEVTEPGGVAATLSLPAAGGPVLKIPLAKSGPGHYSAYGFRFPFPGTWKLEVVVLIGEFDDLRYSTDVPIP